jgi:alpha-galactosidase/6-phospho-beta-glucosidase family protein
VELEVNVRNDGLIPNQPDHSVVEVPSVIGGYGVRGVAVAPLPQAIADVLRARTYQQDLAVDAAFSSERILALLALLADPLVRDLPFAEGDHTGDQPAWNNSGKTAGSV